MKYSFSLLVLTASIIFTSCVSKKQFTNLQTDYNRLQTEQKDLQRNYQESQLQLAESRTRVASLEERLAEARKNNEDLRAAYAEMQGLLNKSLLQNTQGNVNITKLVDEINSSNRFIQHLVQAKNRSDSLNIVMINNLTRSLTRDEMQDLDIKVLKGVVYISLDDRMLYRSGGYEISTKAGEILSKIAKIIMDYKDYSVLVEGNTDTDPISRPNIRNNWDLSALRASSVVQALQNNYGVDPKRLTAAGRGEYNPIATNSTAEGKALNRRTQIIITPELNQFMELIDQAPKGPSNID
ncbi:MAG: OmpA family protein [Dysgonomonas mossii]|uniref:OmpA family protein n=1 Tax=Dysgonomonas mossii TaxID=163665 RepID=UPI001D7FA1F4|nr:OmpA family protein [Dysgonomonas mossii]MBS5797568.1 OmpA family protein [Dysgonomonas mossii]MBS7111447.1 OmpA family protein [Dysgonomonas mossii]